MEDADVDIEGDFDFQEAEIQDEPMGIFTAEQLSMQQEWNLDDCSDDESKAMIKQMLQEERYYIHGQGTLTKPSASPTRGSKIVDMKKSATSITTSSSSSSGNKLGYRKWTEDEKQILQQGMDIYGNKWSKIADLLPGRSNQQVMAYGHKLLKQMAQKSLMETADAVQSSSRMEVVNPLVLTATGKPTCGKLSHEAPADVNNVDTQPTATNEIIRIQKQDSDSDLDVDIDDDVMDNSAISEQRKQLQHPKTANGIKSCHVNSKTAKPTEMVSILKHSLESTSQHNNKGRVVINNNCRGTDMFLSDENEDTSQQLLPDSTHQNRSVAQDSRNETQHVQDATHSTYNPQGVAPTSNTTHHKTEATNNNTQHMHKHVTDSEMYTDSKAATHEMFDGIKKECHNKQDVAPVTKEEKCSVDVEQTCEKYKDQHLKLDTGSHTLLDCNGKEWVLDNPTSEVNLDRAEPTEGEQVFHVEFFDQRPGLKTPKRYMKIRNIILDQWIKQKPKYLSKTAARALIKNSGDVRCISRVHEYLEQIGAINFGCAEAQYTQNKCKRRHRKMKTTLESSELPERISRKRKVKDQDNEIDGRTFDHTTNSVTQVNKVVYKAPVPKPEKYNPFKLIACREFDDKHQADFSVHISPSALCIMDTHAHLSAAEIIGLLGGMYDATTATLSITQAEPCASISTGVQCEMDPVSQTEASERLSQAGLSVVGWYHSHPNFEPNPSVRDLETQTKFQEWFALGGAPFVGIIVNPYNKSMVSCIKCLSVRMPDKQKSAVNGDPYQYDYTRTVQLSQSQWGRTKEQLQTLFASRRKLKDAINLHSSCKTRASDVFCLDMMLKSIAVHLDGLDDLETMISEVKELAEEPVT